MLSKAGLFDSIRELREETGKHFELITSRQVQTLWNIYQRSTRKAEFKEKAKLYLQW